MASDLIEVEVGDLPPLRPEEASLLDMHSMLNNLNILQSELAGHRLTLAQDADLLKDGLTVCREMIAALGDREKNVAERRRASAALRPHDGGD